MSEKLFKTLKNLSISYKTYDHPTVFTIDQAQSAALSIPGALCKNLFLKDSKNRFYLVVADHETQISLKKLSKQIHAPELRFANPTELKQHLHLEPGSVTPFGLIHESARNVHVLLDQNLYNHTHAGFHPLTNSATTVMSVTDLERFITACGNAYFVINFIKLNIT